MKVTVPPNFVAPVGYLRHPQLLFLRPPSSLSSVRLGYWGSVNSSEDRALARWKYSHPRRSDAARDCAWRPRSSLPAWIAGIRFLRSAWLSSWVLRGADSAHLKPYRSKPQCFWVTCRVAEAPLAAWQVVCRWATMASISLSEWRYTTTEMYGELPILRRIGTARLTPALLAKQASPARKAGMSGPTTFSRTKASLIPAENSHLNPVFARSQPQSHTSSPVPPIVGWVVPFFRNLVPLAPKCHTFRHDVADARIVPAGTLSNRNLEP